MADKVAGDEFAKQYYKSESGNIYTYGDAILDDFLKEQFKEKSDGDKIEYSGFVWTKKSPILFKRTAEEQKALEEKQKSGGQKRSWARAERTYYDFSDITFAELTVANDLLAHGFFIVELFGVQPLVLAPNKDGIMAPHAWVGHRVERGPKKQEAS